MITLYTFGPAFGLPDPSPFVTKAEVLLKMAGLPYRTDTKGLSKAPKGKLPYIRDGEDIIADSSCIRRHLEKRYTIDFDKGLSQHERGVACAVDKMCEDHLYWLLVYDRWADDANFKRGPAKFFEVAPAPVRSFVKWLIRRQVRRALHGQGASRYTESERTIRGPSLRVAFGNPWRQTISHGRSALRRRRDGLRVCLRYALPRL